MRERTLIILKPNATKKQTIDLGRWLYSHDLQLEGWGVHKLTRKECEEFYRDHIDTYFYESTIEYMTSDEIIFFIMAGENAIRKGTYIKLNVCLKHDYEYPRDILHSSDSVEAAEREIKIFSELQNFTN